MPFLKKYFSSSILRPVHLTMSFWSSYKFLATVNFLITVAAQNKLRLCQAELWQPYHQPAAQPEFATVFLSRDADYKGLGVQWHLQPIFFLWFISCADNDSSELLVCK